jgi:DNA polymerase-3 subunit gamma/tau
MDLIEIDAASNRGIDEIRQLREAVRFVPSRGSYKTYIIDEVHQLTKEAFNALLKTLEEPPAHAVFVLATTELEKVPATIVSRTQHYDFRRPNATQIADRLSRIAGDQGVELDSEGARLIALAAEGSFRDAESILGQIMAVEDKKITRHEVEEILGLPRREAAKKMFGYIAKREATPALALIQELTDSGYDLAYFSKLLMQYFRSALFVKTDPALKRFVENEILPDEYECISSHLSYFEESNLSRALGVISQNMNSFKKNPIPQLPLELTVLELINRSG